MPELELDDLFADGEIVTEAENLDEGEAAGPEDADDEVTQEEAPDDDAGELADDDADDEVEDQDVDDEDEAEGEEPAAEPEPDARDEQIARLEALIQKQQQEHQRSLAEVREASSRPPAPTGPDPQLVSALYATWFGGGTEQQKEALANVPAHIRAQARQTAEKGNRDMVRYALDPAARYNEQVAKYVDDHITHRIKGLVQGSERRGARDAVAKYDDVLVTEADKRGVADELSRLKLKGTNEERLAIAVRLYLADRDKASVAKKSQKLSDKDRDMKARKDARRRTGGKGRGKRGRRKPPEMKGWDMGSYARDLAASGEDVEVPEGFFDGLR